MAYDYVRVSMTFEDSYARTKRKVVEGVNLDAAGAETDSALISAGFQAVSDGLIRQVDTIGRKIFAGAVAAGQNVDAGVTCKVQLAGRPDKATLKWPMPSASKFLAGGILDTSDADIVALAALFAPSTGIATLSDGESITSIISGTLDK